MIAYVNVCIEEYLSDGCQLFPDNPLKPKHHFLLHYPELTLSFGTLIHLWTMMFESKHTYIKTCARHLHNFKHLAKTLANRHQLLQTYYTAGSLFKPSLVCEKVSLLNSVMYNKKVQELFHTNGMSDSHTAVCYSVVFRNIHYKSGY